MGRRRKAGDYRKFNGKKFRFIDWTETKKEADKIKAYHKRNGYQVRVTKRTSPKLPKYSIWRR